MKLRHFGAIVALFSLLLVSCNSLEREDDGKPDDGNNPFTPITLTTKQNGYVRAGRDFACRFIKKIDDNATARKETDWIVSPLSLQIALGMLLNGAQGETAAEICRALGYNEGETDEINAWCKLMLEQLPALDKKTDMSLANAIFYNKKMSLKSPYRKLVETNYEAHVDALDFSKKKDAAGTINKWCDKQTKGMIPEVIKEVDPSALAYLLNAIYFKSEWGLKFPKSATESETFTREDGSKDKVKMMKIKGEKFYYDENEIWQAIELSYGNGAYTMTVVLPQKGHTVSEITTALGKGISIGCTWNVETDLWIPRFETKYHVDLNDILADMGMQRAFNPQSADFSALSEYPSFVSCVMQDAAIKVDEDGSEAAAVTTITMMATSYIPVTPPKNAVFHADHPFLYLITETSTRTILFAGKYSGN